MQCVSRLFEGCLPPKYQGHNFPSFTIQYSTSTTVFTSQKSAER